MPPILFVLLCEGKANFEGCGTLTLPSSEAMQQAPASVHDRLDAIEKVDLSGCENVTCDIQVFAELFGEKLCALDLSGCKNVTGTAHIARPPSRLPRAAVAEDR